MNATHHAPTSALLLAILAIAGCRGEPPPVSLDAKEYRDRMEAIDRDVLIQEGKKLPRKRP